MATYLVTQATGQQSQWVIKHLLDAGAKVHAVVRNPQNIPAALEKEGITIFKGESANFEDIFKAAQGCKGVFLNTFPAIEVQQAKTVVEACEKAGLDSIVASTTYPVGDKTLWDDSKTVELGLNYYFLPKVAVEEAVRGSNFKAYTILRPGLIHYDFLLPGVLTNFPDLPAHGVLAHACDDGARMILTDANDIGRYAAAALQNPVKFGGQEIDLPNDLLTMKEIGKVLAKVSGRDVPVRRWTSAEVEEVKATANGPLFQLWINSRDFTASVNKARENQAKFGIPFTSLEEALQRDKARLLEALPPK